MRGTVLIVDDEPEILTALRDLLEDEFDVWSAVSPIAALEILADEPSISVIVSDQRMPEMTGDVFLSKARGISDAQTILLTGYADLGAVVNAVNHGRISAYMQKPWEPSLLISMVGNAHEQCQLRRSLAEERALLHGLMDGSQDALSFKDAAGRFVRLNRVKAEALGLAPEAALRRREADLSDLVDGEQLAAVETDTLATGRPSEHLEERGSGLSPRYLQVTRVPIPGADGTPRYLAVLEHDVTDRRMMENRLHQAEKMQALGTMAGGVAHDFNNLLTAILGSLELAVRRNDGDARLQRLLENATMAAERGTALTQRLLTFSRQRDLALRSVAANEVIGEMQDLILRSIGPGIVVNQDMAQDLWLAHVDPDQLELALLNLCINARDAMEQQEGGSLTLVTRNLAVVEDDEVDLAAGHYVSVAVRDTGPGIPPEVLARVFEPFFTTKPVGKGTGLGLSMVYGLAQQAGGLARVHCPKGGGTTVEIILPRAPEASA
ncbi:ATP-binding response regulator [Acidisoma silvae]|nr:ATP-binding protein [Acidisoma silvae]